MEEHEIVESLPLPARDRILAAQGLVSQPTAPEPKPKPKPKPKASKAKPKPKPKPRARPNAYAASGKPSGHAPKGKVWSYAESRWVAAPPDAPPTHNPNDALVGREVEKNFDGTMYKGRVQWANSVAATPAPAPAPASAASTEDTEPHAAGDGPAEGGAAAKAPVVEGGATVVEASGADGAVPADPDPTDPSPTAPAPTEASAEEAVTYYRVLYEDGKYSVSTPPTHSLTRLTASHPTPSYHHITTPPYPTTCP